MTVRINLLPHRQEKREKRQKEFQFILAATAIGGALIVFLGQTIINGKLEYQQERNQRLQSAIAQLDKEIAEIKDLKLRINDVLERKRVVEDLQGGRSKAVVLLDELARKLPEGMYLKSVSQQGDAITLQGVADTDARVADLIRSVNDSEIIGQAELIQINAITVNSLKQSAFTLKMKQKTAQSAETKATP